MKKFAIIFCLILSVCLLSTPVRIARDVASTASGFNNQRTIVRDSAGNLYVVYEAIIGTESEVFIARSTDGGASWNATWADLTSGLSNHHRLPTMAIDAFDTLHIIWRGNTVSSDANLLYTRYPNPSITTLCTYSAYPGAFCPSLAVGPNNNVHVAWTGCPSSWLVRYMMFNRATASWGPSEDIGPRTPSRWPSIDVDQSGRPHVVYRNNYSGNYHIAHRMKDGAVWMGYNGQNHDSLDFDDIAAAVEYTSLFIDSLENLHAIWQWMAGFMTNADSVRYRTHWNSTSSWSGLRTIFGNTSADPRVSYSGDVVADDRGNVYIFYHDDDSLFCTIYSDLGAAFLLDTLLINDAKARYPNARGSKWPAFNRPEYPCIDYVYTWAHPDSPVVSLMFDRLCLEPEDVDTTKICAEALFPAEGSITSCADQRIDFFIGCCEFGDTIKITSTDTTVEYYDSTSGTWVPVIALDPTPWGTYWVHLDTDSCNWIWSEFPALGYHGNWFRVLVESGCSSIDTAFIRIQVDNQGTIYANGTYIDTTHGNPGSGSTGWRMLHEFDLTEYFHGGVDTLTIIGTNAGGYAGMLFELYVICAGACCGEIAPMTIDFTVNGDHFTILDPELSWDGDSILTFIPIAPDTFEHGDTIYACLENVADTCTGWLDEPVCITFFVDLQPPVIWGIDPAPDSMAHFVPEFFDFYLADSMAGLDTTSIVFTVDGVEQTISLTPSGDDWFVQWAPDSSLYNRGDTLELCVTAADTASYCPPNLLDSCWFYYITPCRPLDLSVICPLPCYNFVACSSASVVFAVSDTAGFGIDTTRAYFTVIEHHPFGTADTSRFATPSPFILFDFGSDTTVALWQNWSDGDSITIILDSLFSLDGCSTAP